MLGKGSWRVENYSFETKIELKIQQNIYLFIYLFVDSPKAGVYGQNSKKFKKPPKFKRNAKLFLAYHNVARRSTIVDSTHDLRGRA